MQARPDLTFPRRCRLTTKREIIAVLRRPRYRLVRNGFEIFAAPNGLAESRLGVIVGRAFDRRSTRRNRFKRCVREAFRRRQRKFKGLDILVRAKAVKAMEGQEGVRQELSEGFDELRHCFIATGTTKSIDQAVSQSIAVRGVLCVIKAYRLLLSPLLGGRCRFYPTCSSYAMDAVTEWGVVRGVLMAGRRIFKCHPLHPGGYDPVPPALGRGS